MTNGALTLDSILGLHIQGLSDAEIARQLGSSRQNVRQVRLRHKDVVAPIVTAAEKQVTDYLIASKVHRIAELQWWYEQTRAEAEKDGLTIVEQVLTVSKDGRETTAITKDYRASMVREARGILRQVAEELAQLPKAETTVNVTTNVGIALKWDNGEEA